VLLNIKDLEERLYLMNQIYVLIVLVVLRYVFVDLLKDVKIRFDPWILVFEDRTPLALFEDSAHEGDHILHFLRSEAFHQKLLNVELLSVNRPIMSDSQLSKE